eukprot:3851668-Rhodomonas_salina.1
MIWRGAPRRRAGSLAPRAYSSRPERRRRKEEGGREGRRRKEGREEGGRRGGGVREMEARQGRGGGMEQRGGGEGDRRSGGAEERRTGGQEEDEGTQRRDTAKGHSEGTNVEEAEAALGVGEEGGQELRTRILVGGGTLRY